MQRNFNPALAIVALPILLSGCAVTHSAQQSSVTVSGNNRVVSGQIHGGQQQVSNSLVQLYAVGTSGNGSASAPLLTATVRSDANGNFSIGGLYSCTGATQVYITASGGDPGAGPNSGLAMMTALGSCATLQLNAATTFITINELTTVAADFALASFMSDTTHIGATAANATGISNAFAMASALVNPSTGAIATPPAGITLPAAQLNTLADILASCVNTTGPASASCITLFTTTGASDTANAGLYLAKNPGAPAVTALYTLPVGASPFLPTLSSQPNDFTLAITYASPALSSPYGVAIDAAGNAWLTNEAGSSVTKLSTASSSFATQTITSGGLLSPRGISIDRSGSVWVANTGANSVVKLSSAGAVLSGTGFTAGDSPIAIANDSAGNAWVANFNGNSVTELSTSGSATSTLTASLSGPTAVALDASGNVAVSNAGTGSVCLFSNAGALQSCPTDGTLFGPTAVAISPASTLAMSGTTTGAALAGAFTLATSAGAVNVASPVSGGGLALPSAVAYDSAGTAWFANATSISAFVGAAAISPALGLGSLNAPQGIAVDGSGNVWTTNSGDNSVSIFIGLAAPTVTPLSAIVGP